MKHEAIKSSPKNFQKYKSDKPKNTILNSKKILEDLGLDLDKFEIKFTKIDHEKFSLYKCHLLYKNGHCSGGKGLSRELAEAGAYSEAVERILIGLSSISPQVKSKVDFIKSPGFSKYITTNESEIKNPVKIERFFKYYESLDLQGLRNHNLGKNWVDGYSITDEKIKKVPHLLVNTISGSNGCAAGNTKEEAIVQAFCEVCERYSLMEHLFKRLSAPTINSKTIKNKEIQDSIELFNSLNIDVEIKDLTLNNKIPVMGVIFTNNNLDHENNTFRKRMFHKTLSVGSDIDLNNAIMRCFMEKIQACKTRDDLLFNLETYLLDQYFSEKEKDEVIEIKNKEKHFFPMLSLNRSFDDFSFLNKKETFISIDQLSSHKNDDFVQDIQVIKDICRENDWEALYIDYSIPKYSLKVIRIIVPSVSDTLRFMHPKLLKVEDIFNENPIGVIETNKEKIEKLIRLIESDLVDDILGLLPVTIKEKYRNDEKFLILLGLNILVKNKEKSAIIAKLLEERFLPELSKTTEQEN